MPSLVPDESACTTSESAQVALMPADVVFMFPGQGCQYFNMASDLYAQSGVFQAAMAECDRICQKYLGRSIAAIIFDACRDRSERFETTEHTHPAIVSVEYCIARVLLSMGVAPSLILGYSVGEITAAIVAGVIPLDEGLRFCIGQARALDRLCQPGGLLTVLGSPQLVEQHQQMLEGCEIAAYNFAQHFVIAGPRERLEWFREHLLSHEVAAAFLPVSHAFHSSIMVSAEAALRELVDELNPATPRIELVSCTTTGRIDLLSPDHLWRVAREPVRFSSTIQKLEAEAPRFYIDLGPSGTLAAFAAKHVAKADAWRCQASLKRGRDSIQSLERLKDAAQRWSRARQ